MAVPYSYANLAALLAVNVSTLVDESPRLVKNVGWFQYDSTATTGGYAPDAGAGRWFPLVGGNGIGVLSQVETASFTATPFGDYVVNSATDITTTFPPSPVIGTPFSFFTVNTGKVRAPYGVTINSVYRLDSYFAKDKLVKLIYASVGLGWVCPPLDIFNGIEQGLISFWLFNDNSLLDPLGSRDFVDTGTTAIAFTTGIVGSNALDFNNATADYQLSQASVDLSPKTIPFTDTLGFSFFVNLVSGTEPIISQKWSADSTKYTFCVRAIDPTNIEFSIETGGTGAGLFTATATVANTYGVPLLIVATMPVEYTVKSPRTMNLQVNDGAIVSTVITGDYQTSDPLIVGQSESGNQIVGVVDQIRAYDLDPDSNQRTLLYNNGAFA